MIVQQTLGTLRALKLEGMASAFEEQLTAAGVVLTKFWIHLSPEEQLRRLLMVQPGQIYSQQLISMTQELIQNRLGEEGYAFAKVDPVPKLDDYLVPIGKAKVVRPGNHVTIVSFSIGMTYALKAADELAESIRNGGDPAALAKARNLKATTTAPFTRAGVGAGDDVPRALIASVFEARPGESWLLPKTAAIPNPGFGRCIPR